MSKIIRELFRDRVFIRYIISGAIISLLELAVFAALVYALRWSYLLASALIFFFGLIVSFVFRKLWVFDCQRLHHSSKKQLLFYSSVFAASTAVNLLIMFVLIDRCHVDELVAQIIAMSLVGFFTFVAHKTITFRPLPTKILSLTGYIQANREKCDK